MIVLPETASDSASELSVPVARLDAVSKSYGAVNALNRVDLTVPAGGVLALLGPNGAGKTTVVKLLLGLARPTQGRVSVFGGDPRNAAGRTRTGVMLQTAGVPPTLCVREHLDLFSSYYPNPLPLAECIASAGLAGLEKRRFGELSGGQKQRVLFAIALCGNPDLLFLDEPTTGLDVEARQILWAEIRRRERQGKTILLTTHYMEEADALADRIVVLNQGSIIAEGTPKEIKRRAAGRRIRCVTRLGIEEVRALPGVAEVSSTNEAEERRAIELSAVDAEEVVRRLLALDPQLSDLEITQARLEEAFLALTQADNDAKGIRKGEMNMGTSTATSTSSLAPKPGRSMLSIYVKETWYEFLKLWRMPKYALPTILFPTMFYLLFGLILAKRPGADSHIGAYYLATFGAFAVISAALFALGVGVAGERGQGWLEVKRASPMPPMAYFTAKVITSMAFGLIIVLILMAMAFGLGGVQMSIAQAVTLLAVEVLGAVPFCAMGLAIGYFAGPNSAPAIVNLIYMPLAFFSGLWIPIRLFPHVLQRLALFLPPYHLGEMALGVVGMGDGEANWVHLAVLGAFAVLCLVLARAGFRRDEGKLYG